MKKIVLYFFLAVFVAANAFGAADVVISRALPGKATATEKTNVENDKDVSVNRAANRSKTDSSKGEISENKTIVSRSTRASNKPANIASRNTQKNESNIVSRNVQRSGTRPTAESAMNTVGRNARTEAASMNSSGAVRRAGITLRATTAEVGGRAKIAGTDRQTGSNIDEQVRGVQGRASLLSSSKQKTVSAESITNAKDILERTADLNNTCQQQYNECMDQFCAVVDANQKRCSCSANLAKYAKAQQAVEDANAELNDVAQRIRYVGLSADEIHAIFSATEAELEMSKTKDNTKNRSLLDDIADMIKDPTSAATNYTSTSAGDMILDMDFDFSSDDTTDLFGLDLFTNTNDISSKRGKELYKEATKRCKSVLNQCKDAGGTESQITGNYDLAIDKDCIAYEQGLEKLNQQLVSNVRSANLMLQKARLAVLQNKNEYDIKGCVGALETCMLDDMVCGENYLKCLDPTKRYIDENGNVVLGRNIGNITAFMENYNNANITSNFIKTSVKDTKCENGDGACIVNYLMTKIGTGQTVKDGGLCRAVLDKCQQFTYTGDTAKTARYEPYNDVVINYIQRAMVNIKAAQARIISDYASSCMADISTCYNQQITQINSLSTTANVNNIYNIMTGACYNVALTCGYAVFMYDADVGELIEHYECDGCKNYYRNKCANELQQTGVDCNSYAAEKCSVACGSGDKDSKQKLILIQAISDLFYQSLLCPSNSTFESTEHTVDANRTKQGYANNHCKCDEGYTVWGGACVATCGDNEYRNTLGICSACGDDMTATTASSRDSVENDSCAVSQSSSSETPPTSDDNP